MSNSEVQSLDRAANVISRIAANLQKQSTDIPIWKGWPKLPVLRQVNLEFQSTDTLLNIEELSSRIPVGSQGWMRLQSRNLLFSDVTSLDAECEKYGMPLEAEWVSDDGMSSSRLQRTGPTGWKIITTTELGTGQGNIAVLTGLDTFVYGKRGANEGMRYRIYWGHDQGDDPSAIKRIGCRFVGFGKTQQEGASS